MTGICKIRRKAANCRFLALVLTMLSFWGQAYSSLPDSAIVAKVSGEPVTVREFMHWTQAGRSRVIAYYRNTYNYDFVQGFWTKSFDGKTPSDMLKQLTLDTIVNVKVQQMEASKYGIETVIPYDDFLLALERENTSRLEAKRNNKVIYGPVQYAEGVYFNYCFSNMVNHLKMKLDEKVFAIKEPDLMQLYEKDKDSLYRRGYYTKARLYSLGMKQGGTKEIDESILSKFNRLKSHASADTRKETSELRKSLATHPELTFQVENIILNDSLYSGEEYDGRTAKVKEVISTLLEGQFSNEFEFRGCHCLVKVIKKESLGFSSFSSCARVIKSRYLDSLYMQHINNLIKQTKVELNQAIYKEININ
jgi:hypothetical protein